MVCPASDKLNFDASQYAPKGTQAQGNLNAADCIKILVATDNHIGVEERDPIRGRDSFNTFREILQIATENDVDMVLLGGDLFHENKPSRSCMYQTTALLREFCMSPRPIELEVVSDAGFGLGRTFGFPPVNYEDPHINIGLPVFSIHGNHDDPQGAGPDGALCALDVLAASGLVNYFGRQDLSTANEGHDAEGEDIGMQIRPVLLRKGETKLALYGVGNIRDERFHAEMRRNRISMFRPAVDAEEYFNLLVIHQNRVSHVAKASVPENGFDDAVDLVIWGHEHDCRIEPEEVAGKKYKIIQPGSSVATSLAPGESIVKHIALIKIQGKDYTMDPIPLRTVRPFLTHEITLDELDDDTTDHLKKDRKNLNTYLKKQVNELIAQASREWDEAHADATEPVERMLPLIRLKVIYTADYSIGNPQRLGQEFAGKVANPKDVVLFSKRRGVGGVRKKKVEIDVPDGMDVDGEEGAEGEEREGRPQLKMEDLVHKYLAVQQLQVIAENGMTRAIERFVDKDEKDAIKDFIHASITERAEDVVESEQKANADSEEEIDSNIGQAKERAVARIDKDGYVPPVKAKGKGKAAAVAQSSDDSDDSKASSVKAKGKKPAAKGKGKAAAKALSDFGSDDDDDASGSPAPKAKKAPAKKAAATKAPTKAKAPAKKKETSTQSQLSFGRATGSRAAAAKGAKKTKAQVDSSSDSE